MCVLARKHSNHDGIDDCIAFPFFFALGLISVPQQQLLLEVVAILHKAKGNIDGARIAVRSGAIQSAVTPQQVDRSDCASCSRGRYTAAERVRGQASLRASGSYRGTFCVAPLARREGGVPIDRQHLTTRTCRTHLLRWVRRTSVGSVAVVLFAAVGSGLVAGGRKRAIALQPGLQALQGKARRQLRSTHKLRRRIAVPVENQRREQPIWVVRYGIGRPYSQPALHINSNAAQIVSATKEHNVPFQLGPALRSLLQQLAGSRAFRNSVLIVLLSKQGTRNTHNFQRAYH